MQAFRFKSRNRLYIASGGKVRLSTWYDGILIYTLDIAYDCDGKKKNREMSKCQSFRDCSSAVCIYIYNVHWKFVLFHLKKAESYTELVHCKRVAR